MARQQNPYRPGFNQAPVVFAGRKTVLDAAEEALAIAASDGRTPRPLILTGPRGLGKTVTLGEIVNIAKDKYSWPAVRVEAKSRTSVIAELQERLAVTRTELAGQSTTAVRSRRARVTGGSVGAKVLGLEASVDLAAVSAPEQSLLSSLRHTMEQAQQCSPPAGVVLTLDELQNAPQREIELISSVIQESVPEDWPLVVVIAALPSLRQAKGQRRLPTYLERAEWHVLDDLSDAAAREALAGPARLADRPMTGPAQDILLRLSGGYPYAIQVAGHHAWRASRDQRTITATHARTAAESIHADLANLFAGRWDGATPKEKEYLRAVAELSAAGTAPGGGAVAAHLGADVRSISYLRERLITKGTLYRAADGRLHFITPGMATWVLETQSE